MFNKKLKLELVTYKNSLDETMGLLHKANQSLAEKEKELHKAEQFNVKIDDKIEKLFKPRFDDLCMNLVSSATLCTVSQVDSKMKLLNKSYENLQSLLESQAKDLEYLKQRDEEFKSISFLMAKVEQLINKLNKK